MNFSGMMGVSYIIKGRTFIARRLLLILHQKAPPQSMRVSASAAVPSSIGHDGFAALFSRIFKTTPGSGKSILQQTVPVIPTSTASRVEKGNYWLSSVTGACSDRGLNKKKRIDESTGEIDYLVDFTSYSYNHHYHRQLGHISDQSVTFRCVASNSLLNNLSRIFRVNSNTNSYITLLQVPTPICPIRTFSSSSSSSSESNDDTNMSKDIGDQQMVDGNIQDMRKPYRQGSDTFDIKDLASQDPITQFGSWFQEACKQPDIKEPNAISLATASREGKPSVRMVLLKGFGKDGFKIYTNFDSRKGKELMENPFCSICMHWEPLNRSVRIEGKVERLSEQESTDYFHARPRGSQLGAIVSNQSTVIPSREYLMNKYADLEKKYGDEEVIPKPDFWGGYLIKPDVIEFWQGQTTRVHDRLRFRKKEPNEVLDPELTHEGENGWVIERLSP